MGVLNVTPDSFSDGGNHLQPQVAVEHALRMVDEGADFIDIGGESSRPGAQPVSEEEEWARIGPVVEALGTRTSFLISIDTQKPGLARRCVEAGAVVINDIGGLRDPAMMEAIAQSGASAVIMHMRETPETMQQNVDYWDVVQEVRDYLLQQSVAAQQAGIAEFAIDPGLGFGKTARQNFEILSRLEELVQLGYPVMIGPSRKSFLGSMPSQLPVGERLEGTLAVVAAAVQKGAKIVRAHDVKQCRRVLEVMDALKDVASDG